MLMKGALISFTPTLVGVMPSAVTFQYNPETITHAWQSASAAETDRQGGGDPLAVAGIPGEEFSFTLMMDSNEIIADGNLRAFDAQTAVQSGLLSWLAAIEMLQYPVLADGPPLLGTVSAAVSAAGTASGACGQSTPDSVPRLQVPVVLLVLGVLQILPVRVVEVSVTQKLFDQLLNPTQAEVQLRLKVLTPDNVVNVPQPMKAIAQAAYIYTQAQRQQLANESPGGPVGTLLGMLPISF
jgi:hypothetical protein